MNTKLFTKSAFKTAMHCPMQAYYMRNKEYENQSADDDFLKSLAEGGFQVGAIAKIYGEVPAENDLEGLSGYDEPLEKTKELFKQEKVNIAEAAFKYKNCFVRADIVQKDGNKITLIEVKAKSWAEGKAFSKKNRAGLNVIDSSIRDYVYDVAFQKWVITNALKELYPNQNYTVHAALMLADKTKVNDIPRLNSLFRIKSDKNGRSYAEIIPDAYEVLKSNHTHVIRPFDVDEECDLIIAGRTGEQMDVFGKPFADFVEEQSNRYVNNEKVYCALGSKCFKCPFTLSDEGKASGKKSGYEECWRKMANFTDADFEKPSIKELNGSGLSGKNSKNKWIEKGLYFISDITEEIYPRKESEDNALSTNERKWIQIDSVKKNNNEPYILKDALREQMQSWVYPLHMIDFETTSSALPYHANMRPYENVAFQFSHHVIYEDGRIEHAGQFLNIEPGEFPNFAFVRELKKQLEKDNGSVFRYSNHENTILNGIHDQLEYSREADREELMAFIETITHYGKEGDAGFRKGERDMIDLCDIVKKYYWHPSMKGSNSIKQVLPAVLKSSSYLQKKYGDPIYGSEIKSLNYTSEDAIALLIKDENGDVKNPYKVLPHLKDLEEPIIREIAEEGHLTEAQLRKQLSADEDEDAGFDPDIQINNGGLPLVIYRYLQTFGESTLSSDVHKKTIEQALLRYCELDTMAMVLVWEYFAQVCGSLYR